MRPPPGRHLRAARQRGLRGHPCRELGLGARLHGQEWSVSIVYEQLLDALTSIPRLDGAACRGEHDLFESSDPCDIEDAIAICGRCCELTRCQQWLASLPPRHAQLGVSSPAHTGEPDVRHLGAACRDGGVARSHDCVGRSHFRGEAAPRAASAAGDRGGGEPGAVSRARPAPRARAWL